MSDTTLRAEIKAKLDSMTGIGVVHDYERFAVDPAKFLMLFQDFTTRLVYGWEIGKAGIRLERYTNTEHKVTHNFLLKGYYSLKDLNATEKLFNVVIESILIKFANEQLYGASKVITPQAPNIQARLFGGILCHYAEIEMPVTEIVAKPDDTTLDDLLGLNLEYFLDPVEDGVADAADTVTLT